MEFKFQHIFIFLSVALVASHAALTSQEDYWRSVLPNSLMPKAVKDLLHPEFVEDKSTAVGVSKGGVGVNAGSPGKGTNVGVGKGGVVVGAPTKSGKPVYVGVTPGPVPFLYKYAAEENQIHDDPNVVLFFLEKDLYKGNNMKLHFFKSSDDRASFLPRQVADSIPFSSKKFPEILDRFSLNPSSEKAEIMKKTIQECEETGIKGEEKYCATSLESMVDFSTSKLGRKVEANYKIVGVKKLSEEKAVVCHKQKYPYAVFYCHKTETTVSYKVAMVGDDGTKVKAAAVCHKDTAAWNPKHLAFQVLKVKPGTVPVCHFLPQDHIVWVPKY
ncbi:unnamed protein product [Fraxinus pennsylvanica]|uniref:BURP domain-containing protein n=1 Tax=Fraxinus pennsylvanica TaxID=56036 RepID=A0AAD2AAY2_9LAMI|nr:unnamed protein product [Fraxinus pennsylvanica]